MTSVMGLPYGSTMVPRAGEWAMRTVNQKLQIPLLPGPCRICASWRGPRNSFVNVRRADGTTVRLAEVAGGGASFFRNFRCAGRRSTAAGCCRWAFYRGRNHSHRHSGGLSFTASLIGGGRNDRSADALAVGDVRADWDGIRIRSNHENQCRNFRPQGYASGRRKYGHLRLVGFVKGDFAGRAGWRHAPVRDSGRKVRRIAPGHFPVAGRYVGRATCHRGFFLGFGGGAAARRSVGVPVGDRGLAAGVVV